MRLVIDTTQPLTDTDHTLLRALLNDTPTPPTSGHRPVARTPDQIAATINDTIPPARRPTATAADAKLPVTAQAGVRTRESTPDDA